MPESEMLKLLASGSILKASLTYIVLRRHQHKLKSGMISIVCSNIEHFIHVFVVYSE